jgi:hypothetical protein
MSDDKDKKKGFAPFEYFSSIWGMTITLFLAWLVFNLVLLAGIWLIVRLTHSDIDPFYLRVAGWLTKDRIIDLQEVAPGVQTIRHVFRLDTDGDGVEEWLVLYRYDATTGGTDAIRHGPYGAAVYDVDRCRPPAIVTYELRPLNYDYVAENLSIWWGGAPKVQDVNNDGRDELVLQIGNNLSIFRWFDDTQDCRIPEPGMQGYELLGSFRGSGNVRLKANGRVEVFDRGFFERSQMAVKSVYRPRPDTGSYLGPNGQGLGAPVEVGIDFAFGLPVTSTQLYYPEKAVLAFYLNLGQDDGEAKSYLCSDARSDYPIKDHQFGIALPREEMARVLVKEIVYTPNTEAERLHDPGQPLFVTIAVVGVDSGGRADEGRLRRVRVGVVGVAKEGALPYNCEWCLQSFEVVP